MRLKHRTPSVDIYYRETSYEPLGLTDLNVEWRLSTDSVYGLNRTISVTELTFVREDRQWLYGIYMAEGPVAMVWAEIFGTWWVLDFSTAEMTPELFKASFQSPSIDTTTECEIRPVEQYIPAVRAETLEATLETFSNHNCSYYRGEIDRQYDSLTVSMPDAMAYNCTTDSLGGLSLKPSMDTFENTYKNYIAAPSGEFSGVSGLNMVLYSYLKKWDTDHNTPGLHTDGWFTLLGGPVPKVDARDALFTYDITSSASPKTASFTIRSKGKIQVKPGTVLTRHFKAYIVIFGLRTVERGVFDNTDKLETVTPELLDATIYGISPVVDMSTVSRSLDFTTTFNANILDVFNRYAYETVSFRYSHYVKSMQKWIVAMPVILCADATYNPRTYIDFTFEAAYTVRTNMRKALKGFYGERLVDIVNRHYAFTYPDEIGDIVIGDMSLKKDSDPVKTTLGDILTALSGVGYGFVEKSGGEGSSQTIQCLKLRDFFNYPKAFQGVIPEEANIYSITADDPASALKTGQKVDGYTSQSFSEREITLSGARTPEILKDLQGTSGVETNAFKIYDLIYNDSDNAGPFMVDMGNTGANESTYLTLNGRWTNARVIKRYTPLGTGIWSMAGEYYWKGSPYSEITVDIDGNVVNEGATVLPTDLDRLFTPGVYHISMPLRDATPLFSDLRTISYGGSTYFPLSIAAGQEPDTVDVEAKRYAGSLYTVTPIASDNITFDPDTPQSVEEMTDCRVRVHAQAGYTIALLIVDGVGVTPAGSMDTEYVFRSVTSDHTIAAKAELASNMYFEAQEDNTMVYIEERNYPEYHLQYSVDGTTFRDFYKSTRVFLNKGGRVWFKGTYTRVNAMNYYSFRSDKPVYCNGSVMSIAYSQNDSIERPYQFYKLFEGMTTLLSAPGLPAVKLQPYCYAYMFSGCINLRETPDVKSDYIDSHACCGMFHNCKGVKYSYRALKNVEDYAYCNCYNGCASLEKAGSLIVNSMGSYACDAMYANCGSLEEPPELNTPVLSPYCFYSMFSSSMLLKAPETPVKTLVEGCYSNMFSYTYLTESPLLPAPSLQKNSCREMFTGCYILNKITCLATDVPSGTTTSWVDGVSDSGLFLKSPAMVKWDTGVNGVPENWTVEDYKENE